MGLILGTILVILMVVLLLIILDLDNSRKGKEYLEETSKILDEADKVWRKLCLG